MEPGWFLKLDVKKVCGVELGWKSFSVCCRCLDCLGFGEGWLVGKVVETVELVTGSEAWVVVGSLGGGEKSVGGRGGGAKEDKEGM